MATKRRTEIIVETERVIVVPPQTRPIHLWCQECCAQVEMLTPEQAAQLIQVTPRVIYRWIESQLLHFREEPDGQVLICHNALYGQVTESQ
ncbi:MAG TPA: helix-turn-helix domain-containing protein [Blastocatellia bacterium]|nr:helix-turn-helix domain-containing protein [Blastocatellia bacterium]